MAGSHNKLFELTVKRHRILRAILPEPKEKRDLAKELPLSRPTIDRAIRELEDVGLVIRVNGVCQLTLLGRVSYEQYHEMNGAFEQFKLAQPLLRQLPQNAPIDDRLLASATTYECDERAPYSPFPFVREMIDQASEVRGILSRVLPKGIETVSPTSINGKLDRTFVIHAKTLQSVLNTHENPITELLSEPNYTLWESSNVPSFDLFLVDRSHIFIRVYSWDAGQLLGAIINDAESAIEWGHELFWNEKQKAARVDPSSL